MEPFGAYRDNIHAAMIAQILFNSNRSGQVSPAMMEDFLIRPVEEVEQEKRQSIVSLFDRLAGMSEADQLAPEAPGASPPAV